jgi:SEC-C motif-containing protein
MSSDFCPCGSGQTFAQCCDPLIAGKSHAANAEQLMRSRYTAYARNAVDYILRTTHPDFRKYYSKRSIRQWSEANHWNRLEIHAITPHTVTFSAYFTPKNGLPEVHREHSSFVQENGRWYFTEGMSPDEV